MIVAGRPLVLSAAASTVSLANSRILWENRARFDVVDATNVTVSGETDAGPRDAPLRPDTAEYWEAPSLPATWQVDLLRSYRLDTVGLVHTLGSSRSSVLAETSPDATTWTQIVADMMPATDAPLMLMSTTVREARYLRLTFSGSTGSVPPAIAVVYVGESLAMEKPLSGGYAPIDTSRESVLRRQLSRGGQFLGQSFQRHGVTGTATYKHLTRAWVRESFDPFVKSARLYPYFFAANPENFPEEVAYVWAGEDIRPVYMNQLTDQEVSWPLIGIGLE
jgi:hypothetical protein